MENNKALGKSPSLNNNLFSLNNTWDLIDILCCSDDKVSVSRNISVSSTASGFWIEEGEVSVPETGVLVAAVNILMNRLPHRELDFFLAWSQSLRLVRCQRMNHWYLSGNLSGWAVDDNVWVCCQVSLCRETRFTTMEKKSLSAQLCLIWFSRWRHSPSLPPSLSLPVRRMWVTLTRMWFIVVIDTVVVNWPVVRVGRWGMGDRERITKWSEAESAFRQD